MILKNLIHSPLWEVLDSGVSSAQSIMSLDEKLLKELKGGAKALIHFYEWEKPSVTYGYFLDPKKHLNLEEIEKRGMTLARRPTGGGIVFHPWDCAFSVLVPAHSPFFSLNTLENYRFVNEAVLKVAEEFLNTQMLRLTSEERFLHEDNYAHFCMARPTKYDVVLKERKVAGAAQRKTKDGFLHQGTIALVVPPCAVLEELLLNGRSVVAAMRAHTLPLLSETATEEEKTQTKKRLRALLIKHLSKNYENSN